MTDRSDIQLRSKVGLTLWGNILPDGRPVSVLESQAVQMQAAQARRILQHLERGRVPRVDLNRPERAVAQDSIHPKQVADKKVFSKSDLAVLDHVVKTCGHLSAAQLRNKTHRQTPWLNSDDCCPIDYALFFEEHPGAEEIKALAEAEQESRDVLRPYAAD